MKEFDDFLLLELLEERGLLKEFSSVEKMYDEINTLVNETNDVALEKLMRPMIKSENYCKKIYRLLEEKEKAEKLKDRMRDNAKKKFKEMSIKRF